MLFNYWFNINIYGFKELHFEALERVEMWVPGANQADRWRFHVAFSVLACDFLYAPNNLIQHLCCQEREMLIVSLIVVQSFLPYSLKRFHVWSNICLFLFKTGQAFHQEEKFLAKNRNFEVISTCNLIEISNQDCLKITEKYQNWLSSIILWIAAIAYFAIVSYLLCNFIWFTLKATRPCYFAFSVKKTLNRL